MVQYYVDHAKVNGGRLQQSYAGNTSILILEKFGLTAEMVVLQIYI